MNEIKKCLYQDCIDSKQLGVPCQKWLIQAENICNSLLKIGVKEPYKNYFYNLCHGFALDIYGGAEYLLGA
jgi:hypothetical protein